jgi:pyruvate/2-oxoglutarate dehydrogenase complex dihydrolipoamide dehydrogenase (E3) component
VLGAGAVGVEFAQAFARFGTRVTLVEAAERALPAEEPEAGAVVEQSLADDGITVRTGAKVTRVSEHDGQTGLELGDGTTVVADRLLVATGRRTELADLGVDLLGVDGSSKSVPVDDRLRVAPGVWAVGDVTGKGAFTHVATYQAQVVVREVLGQQAPAADYRALPRVTFTDPEVGAVGMTERQARDAGLRVRTGLAQVPSSARGWIHKAGNSGVVKLVEDSDRGPRGRHLGRPGRRRGPGRAGRGGARRGAHRTAAADDVRLSDLPPGHRGCPEHDDVTLVDDDDHVVTF